MIRQPTESIESSHHFLIIAGVPGIGKTTLGLSSPAPLLINLDKNYRKVNPAHRVAPHITPANYKEVIGDLRKEDLSSFKTLVFDTGGALVSLMAPYVIGLNNTNSQRDGMTLSMKGYGAIKTEFESLVNMCINDLRKHIVMIFHTIEKEENDQTVYRIDIAGSSGRFAWKKAEIGGFMSMGGKKRTIDFSPTAQHHAKSAYDILGVREIPATATAESNTFITDIFREADTYLEKEKILLQEYKELMDGIRGLLENVTDQATANDLLSQFPGFKWVYAAKREAWTLLVNRSAECNLKYDPVAKQFLPVKEEKCDT